MMEDMKFDWLTMTKSPDNNLTDNDAEGSIDGNSMDFTQAMDSMMLDEGSATRQRSQFVWESKTSKRKRTSSQVSPPKVSHLFILFAPFINMPQKDGGRGPTKRRKDTDDAIQSVSPVEPAGEIDELGFFVSPVAHHSSPISNVSSPPHDTSSMEPWDAETSNDAINPQADEPNLPSDNDHWDDDEDDQLAIPEPQKGPVVLVPDSQSSLSPQPSHATPSGARSDHSDARSDMSKCSNVPADASLVADSAPCPKDARTDTTTDSPEDVYEVSFCSYQ
jgi:hypothetical protein